MSKEKQELLNTHPHTIVCDFHTIRINDSQLRLLESIAEVKIDGDNNKSFWINNMEYKLQSQQPPKEWEVMIFKNKATGTLIGQSFPGYTQNDYTGKNAVWDIYSVKRLSDGEVFTVGEDVNNPMLTIQGFKVDNDGGMTVFFKGVHGQALFSHILKRKQPLFTTEDGVGVSEGDDIHGVDIEEFRVTSHFKLTNQASQKQAQLNGVIWFSTKEAAEEYVLWNKPCLSLNEVDGHGLVQISENKDVQFYFNAVKQLAKSKMK